MFSNLFRAVLAGAVLSGVACASGAAPPLLNAAERAHILAQYGAIPLSFEANRGQTDSRVQYLAHGAGYSLFLDPTEAVLKLQGGALRMHLVAANSHAPSRALGHLTGSVNYFTGNDPKKWTTGVQSYRRVSYRGVYPGIDLVYYGNQRQLEYDFRVAPGADPGRIALQFTGASPQVDSRGDLVLSVRGSETRFHKPVVYQMRGDVRVGVDAAYRERDGRVSFALGPYNHRRALIIDPVLSYMTYLGGSGADFVGNATSQNAAGGSIQSQGIAVDSTGSVYVTGSTESVNFPLVNAYESAGLQHAGLQTAFVTKLNPAGTAFVYSTYLGGTAVDYGFAIAVDAAGSAYVVGETSSPDFPVKGAYQAMCSPQLSSGLIVTSCGYNAHTNAFVTKLSPDGKSLVYSTFLGGDDALGGEAAYGVTVDAKGQAYVVGQSADFCGPIYAGGPSSPAYYCFPTTPGALVAGAEMVQAGNMSLQNGFLSVFSADGSTLLYSTLLAHSVVASMPPVNALDVALDPAGNIYVTGGTFSGQLPTTTGAFQAASGPVTVNSGADHIPERAYVAKFSALGATTPALTYLTYLGGLTTQGTNYPTGIAADAAGNAYVIGPGSSETDLPTTTGAYQTTCNGSAAYLAKLNPTGSNLVLGTCFGGLGTAGSVNFTSQIALDASGNVLVALTGDSSLPRVNPVVTAAGGTQPWVVEFDPTGSKLLFSSPLGGPLGGSYAAGLALDASGGIYLAGQTFETDLPVTAGAAQSAYGGGSWDSFVTKFVIPVATTTTLAVAPQSAIVGQAVSLTATVTAGSGAPTPTGTVTFMSGTATLGTATLNGTGMGSTTLSSLTAGSYSITAAYSGDAKDQASTASAQALTVAPPPAPVVTISASPATITVGAVSTLTWSATNAASCTASGSWSGTEAVSGTASETPAASGTATYTLTCTGAGGSGNASATVTVNAASSGGGGGAFDWLSIAGLFGLVAWRLAHQAGLRSCVRIGSERMRLPVARARRGLSG